MNFVFKRTCGIVLSFACASIGLAYRFSINCAISFALGAGIDFFSTVLFGRIFFRSKRINTANKIVHAFYIGETIKILTTIISFILVFQWRGVSPLFLFLGFISAQLGCLFILLGATRLGLHNK